MKKVLKINLKYFCLALCGFVTGCATSPYSSRKYDLEKTFYLSMESDPPGALVVQEKGKRREVLGKTPMILPFRFVKKPSPDFIGQLGYKTWQLMDPESSPWKLVEIPETKKFRLQLNNIKLEHGIYEDEQTSYKWDISKDFMVRNVLGEITCDEPNLQEHSVVLRKPVKPEFYRTLQIVNTVEDMTLFSLESESVQGREIGKLPLESRFGFGRVRDDQGRILKWLWWSSNTNTGPFSLSPDGKIFLTGRLDAPNYEPLELQKHLLTSMRKDGSEVIRVPLRMTTPEVPQSVFQLKVDSLPSNADVYEVLEDGTLGAKIGETPFDLQIGLGQKLQIDPEGSYLHDDWLVWMTNNLIKWQKEEDGSTVFFLTCGLFEEGFAIEQVHQEIFRLIPGRKLPTNRTLTVPLLHPEQAAVRDARKLSPQIVAKPEPTPIPERRPFVWKEPDPLLVPEVPVEKKKPFWKRF
ncbi:MAG: hypothetical protein ACO3N7_10055 [Kiritimatiellia bacterium]